MIMEKYRSRAHKPAILTRAGEPAATRSRIGERMYHLAMIVLCLFWTLPLIWIFPCP